MKYFSCFSGIEAASVAWHGLGWEPVGFSEIDPFASAVLAHRFPNVRNYGDITKFAEWDVRGPVDLLVGGSPCQAFSVAGLRRALDDPRGQLTLTYLALAARMRPRWIVWENVPGVLSADSGRPFGAFLGGLEELGYGWAYRVLDARYFGVPQRRRRVFLVARSAGDWRSAASVLFERPGSVWNYQAIGTEGEAASTDARGCAASSGIVYGGAQPDIADTVTAKWSKGSGGPSGNECGILLGLPDVVGALTAHGPDGMGATCVDANHVFPYSPHGHYNYQQSTEAATLQDRENRISGSTHLLAVPIQDGVRGDKSQNGLGVGVIDDPSYTLDTTGSQSVFTVDMQACKGNANTGVDVSPTLCRPSGNDSHVVAYRKSKRAQDETDDEAWVSDGIANTLNGFDVGDTRTTHAIAVDLYNHANGGGQVAVATGMVVRRLTPLECERLQGFPDGWTDIIYRGRPASDGPRYKALGNSMAVPCMAWIGSRIQASEDGVL